MSTLMEALKRDVDGEVHFDAVHRKVYSVDASIYEVEPIGIVIPKNKAALVRAVEIAREFRVPIIARGAATGIAGGCIGKALIIDTSKYLNQILEINFDAGYAICEPGVVQDRLNEALSPKGYRLGPDTSTGNRATLGGMLANNSAGARSLRYGAMVDHVEEVELVLASGEILRFQPLTEEQWQEKCAQPDAEGFIYQQMHQIREQYRSDIQKHFPKIPRRVSGYNLDALLKPGRFNPCRLIAGSEGTLGIATEIKVSISKKPQSLGICIVHLDDMIAGMRTIPSMLAHHPIALEMIDTKIIEMGRQSPAMRNKLSWLNGKPQAVFVAEFDGETPVAVQQKLAAFTTDMKQRGIGYAHICLTDPAQTAQVWEVRKSGLGLLLSKRTYSRAIAFLEDVTVAPEQLAPFMEKFCNYLHSKGKEAGIYGHVGSGCMHVRPYIDLRQADELHLMEQMMQDVSDLLLQHGGALSGEHGDGFVRSWLNKKMFGDRLYQAFLDLKSAFDPDNRMNPGKIVHGPPFLENLRLNPTLARQKIKTFLDFSREGGFELAADLCNGNGMCRKSEKVMCPSFQATGDEFHTTRARAQTLRAVINGRLPIRDFTSQGVHDVMDLCLECKGCKTECPSEVNMAKMKSEFLYQYQKAHGTSLRSSLFANIGKINAWNAPIAKWVNRLTNSLIGKKVTEWLGIASERSLPQLAEQRFSEWFKTHTPATVKTRQTVVLLNDTFTEFNHPEIGQAAVHILELLGYVVIVPRWQCCGRPALSKGKLESAQKMAQALVQTLAPYAYGGIPIIGLEPSCLLTIKDDFAGLLGKTDENRLQEVIDACTTFDEFISTHLTHDGKLPFEVPTVNRNIFLHGHCHQKALVGTSATLQVLRAIPGCHVTEIDSGCCGMAGSFGYEKEHYKLSMDIGELKLFPAVRKADDDAFIVADGFSCRCQISHGTGRTALHLAEMLSEVVNPKSCPCPKTL